MLLKQTTAVGIITPLHQFILDKIRAVEEIVPVTEEAGVSISIHPDDTWPEKRESIWAIPCL